MSAQDGDVVVPYRITQALDLRAMYGPGVDEACGVREPTVDQWETGEVEPTAEQLRKLAVLTDLPIEFFYRPVDIGDDLAVWMCQRSGRGKGCTLVQPGPPVRQPLAPALPLEVQS